MTFRPIYAPGIDLGHASTETPRYQPWDGVTEEILDVLLSYQLVRFNQLTANGEVRLELAQDLPASERGPLLLNIESELRTFVDEGLTVWLEPLGDRNSLRKLRGIEVKVL